MKGKVCGDFCEFTLDKGHFITGIQMDINSLSHTKWNCKYHIVFAPKFRRKVAYVELKHDIPLKMPKLYKFTS